jgi:hypothetical protein
MKKWMYVISVGGMLAIFLFFYFAHMEEAQIKEKARLEMKAQAEKAEADRKAAIEAKAREDAAKRAAERDAEIAQKAAERLAKQEAEDRKIKETTDELIAKGNVYAKRISELEVELNALRLNKEKLNREAFEFAKQVEQARIAKRNAELEIQRMTDMVAKRAADSALARAPAPPPARRS